MKCQILFSGKNKTNVTNLSSAELAQRVVKVIDCHVVLIGHELCMFACKSYNPSSSQNLPLQILSNFEVCLFVLRFYGPVNPMGSCRARSVYLTTHLLGRLSPQSG